jgi:integrase
MQTLILLGATTGRCLRDLLELRWERVDMAQRVIRFNELSALREVVVPMTAELHAHLTELAKADSGSLVLPGLGRSNWTGVEQQFRKLMDQVGLRGTGWRALRVTFVNQIQMASTTPGEVMAVLNHVKGSKSQSKLSLALVIAKLQPLM